MTARHLETGRPGNRRGRSPGVRDSPWPLAILASPFSILNSQFSIRQYTVPVDVALFDFDLPPEQIAQQPAGRPRGFATAGPRPGVGRGGLRTRDRCRPARVPSARRPPRAERHARCSRPGCWATATRAAARWSACWSVGSTRSAGRRCAPGQKLQPGRADRLHGRRAHPSRRGARAALPRPPDDPAVEQTTATAWTGSSMPSDTCRCRLTSTGPTSRRTGSATRRCTRAPAGRLPRRRRAST